jgi:hypothetical protein
MELTFDLARPALDIVVRADHAAKIPSAQVLVFDGKLARLPKNGLEMAAAMGESSRWTGGSAAPVVDSTRTDAAAKLYQEGDIHARMAAFGPGPVTVCVVPFAGDFRDPKFVRELSKQDDVDVTCRVITVAAEPPVQAFVVETPPMKRLPPPKPE